MLVNRKASVASMIAPAKARPKESPKFPAAEFTPAASLIRSSEIGASVKLLSWETSMPSPDPAMISGIARYHPESARGTTRISSTIPTVSNANPARMMMLGRRFPARLPASNAMANMLRESGASDRPACMALYSSTIWRKIGSAIIMPPSAICCSICWEIPIRKCGDVNRSGSSRVSLPSRLRRTSQ